MDLKDEILILKRVADSLQTCISDIDKRLTSLETKYYDSDKDEHTFIIKDTKGNWLIECSKTGGSFSSYLWRMELIEKNRCPCCGQIVRRGK